MNKVEPTQEQAEARAKALAEGEAWLDALLVQDRERRIAAAAYAVSASKDREQGQACWMGDHVARLKQLEESRQATAQALREIEASIDEVSEQARLAVLTVVDRVRRNLGVGY